jgi:hypothetical protein
MKENWYSLYVYLRDGHYIIRYITLVSKLLMNLENSCKEYNDMLRLYL